MKHVAKGAPLQSFESWKLSGTDDWQPSYAQLRQPLKGELQTALLAEQGGVCCYCGRRVDLGDSHIEHFRPQERHPDLALDHGNLFVSCLREQRPGMPLHCGHAKRASFDEALHISPLDEACESRFSYRLTGEVTPADADDAAAAHMATLLALDCAFLRNRRAEVLTLVFDAAFIGSATAQELSLLRAAFQAKDEAGQHLNLGHVVSRFCGQLMGT